MPSLSYCFLGVSISSAVADDHLVEAGLRRPTLVDVRGFLRGRVVPDHRVRSS